MDLTDVHGFTPLHFAIKAQKLNAVNFILKLLDKDLIPIQKPKENEELEEIYDTNNSLKHLSVIQMAVIAGDFDIFYTLLRQVPPDTIFEQKNKILVLASRKGNE